MPCTAITEAILSCATAAVVLYPVNSELQDDERVHAEVRAAPAGPFRCRWSSGSAAPPQSWQRRCWGWRPDATRHACHWRGRPRTGWAPVRRAQVPFSDMCSAADSISPRSSQSAYCGQCMLLATNERRKIVSAWGKHPHTVSGINTDDLSSQSCSYDFVGRLTNERQCRLTCRAP